MNEDQEILTTEENDIDPDTFEDIETEEVTPEPEPEEDPEEVEEDDEPFDLGSSDEEIELPSIVSDVEQRIKSGDTQGAIKRLGEYAGGIEKLQSKTQQAEERASKAAQQVDQVKTLFTQAASGSHEFVTALDEVLEKGYGTSIEALFMAKTGLSADELAELGVSAKTSLVADPVVRQLIADNAAIKAELAQLKGNTVDQDWVSRVGQPMAKYLESKTGLKIAPEILAKARHELPAKASSSDIEEAVMRVDPRAYRAALAAKEAPTQAPNSAKLSKGGKGSASADPNALLSDPRKFEAYMNG